MNGIYKTKFDNLIVLLLSILPISLAAGPAVIETIVFLIILLFFSSKRSIKFGKSDIIIILLYSYLIISSALSDFKVHSLSSSFFLMRFILLYLIFKYYFLSESKTKIIHLTLITLSFTFVILIIDGFSQYFLNISIFGTELLTQSRMIMHFRNGEYIMGSYLSKMIPIFFGLWYIRFNKLSLNLNFFLLILSILTLLCMILSNDRSATYLIIGFLFGLIILNNSKIYYKITALSLICIIITLIVFLIPSVKNRYIDTTFKEIFGKNDAKITKEIQILRGDEKTKKFLNFKINNKNIFIFSTAHEAHIKTAFNMFLHNPLIGIGPNNFRKLCSEKDYGIYEERGCSTHPHHIMSQILAETGIIGFIFYITIIILIISKLFKQIFFPYLNFNLICMYSFYILLLLPILPSGNIFNNWYIYSIALPLFYLKFAE